MLTATFADQVLNTMDGSTLTAFTPYAGLIKVMTAFRAGTVTEAAYTGYGTRPSISFGAAADTSPVGGRQKANDVAVTFPQNTGSAEDQIGWGIWDAATAGSLKAIAFLDSDPPFFGVGNLDDTIDAYAHGLATDQRVFVIAAPGAVKPTGLSEDVAYFVLASGLTADAFKLSTSSGGAAADITVGGAAMFMPYKAVTVATNATPEFAIGSLVLQLS